MKPLFVAATRQHVGKTSTSLALISGLQKRLGKVGFLKPVGQQHVPVTGSEGQQLRVDKDVELMKEYFGLDHLRYEHASPVIVPRNYTKEYIDGTVTNEEQRKKISDAAKAISESSDVLICEGTGHVGVGSVIGASNADVAGMLGADVLLVANGGIGSAFDELAMNKLMFQEQGVAIKGVVLNKVRPDKVEQVRDYVGRALMDRWGVPLIGVVPDLPFLGKATLGDLEHTLDAKLIAGERFRRLHYGTTDLSCVTTAVRRFLRKAYYRQEHLGERRPLFVTHCTRDDVLLAFLAYYKRATKDDPYSAEVAADAWMGAMVLCKGSCDIEDPSLQQEDNASLPYLMEVASAYDAPIMLTEKGTIEATNLMANFTAKMNIGDRPRIAAAIEHYEPHIDFDLLLR